MAAAQQNGAPDISNAFSAGLEKSVPARQRYDSERSKYLKVEDEHAWDGPARKSASKAENRAAEIVWKIREDERENLFGNKATEAIPGPETLDMGGQFLTNLNRIREQSDVHRIAQRMPKGAHLHIHFNSEFSPMVLLNQAEDYVKDTLFIRSTKPLCSTKDLADTEMVFNVLPSETEQADCFSSEYLPEFKKEGSKPWMKWTAFKKSLSERPDLGVTNPDDWITAKMVLSEEEVYGMKQTTNGYAVGIAISAVSRFC